MFQNYRYGGICAVVTAAFCIPALTLYIASMFYSSDEGLVLLGQISMGIYTALLTFLLLFVLTFMEDKLGIKNAKWLLYSMIVTNALIGIPAVFISVHDTELFVYYLFLSTGLSVAYGILSILLGQKLKKASNKTNKHADSVGLWFLVTGILLATYILSPLALITAIVIDVYLALMFFAADQETLDSNSEGSAEVA